MKDKQLLRRMLQYAAGLLSMAVGLVLLKRTAWGVSPITAVPDAVANISPLSLGNATILLHLLCVLLQIAVQRRVTLKSLLTMGIGIPFGYLVDLFMWLWNPTLLLWEKSLALVLGIAIQGLGVALISGCDLMLPAPDELNHVISQVHGKPLSRIKLCADGIYVLTAIVINLLSTGGLASIGLSSVVSVLLTGRFIGLFYRLFPGIKMSAFFGRK